MNHRISLFKSFMFVSFACGVAQGQVTRTWVSGLGDDANPCSRTYPCHTFAGAISKTLAGGEIDALDPGAYGTVNITKAITIDGGSGQIAGIQTGSGANGITVQTGASDAVTIRNVSILGATIGLNGIRFLSGKALHIEHCSITGFQQNGIDLEPTTSGAQVFVSDTFSQDNAGDGLYAIGPSGSLVQVAIDNSRFNDNTNGVRAVDYSRFSIRNSAASGNSQAGFIAQPNAGSAAVSIASSTSANNSIGVQSGGGTSPASVRVSGLSLFINTSGFVAGTNGTIASFGNNYNSGSGTPNAAISAQ